ncbi:exocyst complex component exo84 [Puccinia graminis f. sp. tritici]|uniref:Exocyst complex component EXO84 n=1 Tax=Puccinia graminis f. sp. tritici TaxID=56615 RepID=A0A5B0NFH7_PUCGR|nr:exocyst complex component exo84 [Puccinia graminis f. sp. tritici]KAA1087987.1 exocyst complex component exo84 [Puccinia graminis f. sp. tritici]
MNIPVTPAPRRPGKAGVSLRTQRPTTYYDGEKDASSVPPPTEGGRKPPRPAAGADGLPGGPRPSVKAGHPNRLPPSDKKARGMPIDQSGGARSTEKSKIGAALLNKRQSVSYGHAQPKSTPQPMPPMPAIPGRFGGNRNDDRIGGGVRKQVSSGAPIINIDSETLAQGDFDAEKFMMIHLATLGGGAADPETLKAFKDSLRATHLTTNQSLQENAYKNYGAFVAISKEIATLENEMLELKAVLEEFKTLPNDLDMGLGTMAESNLSGESKRKAARNSIADVNALYRNQLESLWENVEGSQKFLPIQPGRHILSETKSFVELNPITYQPKQAVHLFLLDDSLLIAIQKQTRSTTGKAKLMAEKCFNLAQISIVGLDDTPDLSNALQIQRNQEKVILRTDRAQEKRELLDSFRRVSEEMARKKRKQSLNADHSYRASRLLSSQGLESGSSQFHAGKLLGLGKDDRTHKLYSRIGDLLDEVSVGIACRRYEEAIEHVERARSMVTEWATGEAGVGDIANPLEGRIEARAQELADRLLAELAETSVKKAHLVRTITLLGRLAGPSAPVERAKETFLTMRSELVRRQIGQIKFEGDLALWVSQTSFVLFTLVKNTCEWYMTAFKDNRLASGFVKWAVDQLDLFGEIFRRQVYEGDEDQWTIQESISVTRAHAGMLKEVGLDFGFLLSNVLSNQTETIRTRHRLTTTGKPRALSADPAAPGRLPSTLVSTDSRSSTMGTNSQLRSRPSFLGNT